MPGDGILLYPGKEHVLPSIRLANIRDGEEDYEYLVMAEERIGREKTAAMVRQYVRSPTQFTRDAASLAALRDQLADAITSNPLAVGVLGSAVAALPANVFSIWMNFSGSILANVWSRHQPGGGK